MKFMVIVKATKDSEGGVTPSQQLLTDMGNFNEELAKAGVLLAGDGLHPSAKSARVRFSGSRRTVIAAWKSGFPSKHRLSRSKFTQLKLARL